MSGRLRRPILRVQPTINTAMDGDGDNGNINFNGEDGGGCAGLGVGPGLGGGPDKVGRMAAKFDKAPLVVPPANPLMARAAAKSSFVHEKAPETGSWRQPLRRPIQPQQPVDPVAISSSFAGAMPNLSLTPTRPPSGSAPRAPRHKPRMLTAAAMGEAPLPPEDPVPDNSSSSFVTYLSTRHDVSGAAAVSVPPCQDDDGKSVGTSVFTNLHKRLRDLDLDTRVQRSVNSTVTSDYEDSCFGMPAPASTVPASSSAAVKNASEQLSAAAAKLPSVVVAPPAHASTKPVEKKTSTALSGGDAAVEFQWSAGANFSDFLKPLPHSDGFYLEAKLEFVVENISGPIGITVLADGCIVVGASKENAVKIYSPEGKFLHNVLPGRSFSHPSDMVTLPDGRFAVRDNNGIQLFEDDGTFLHHVGEGVLGRCYGLTTDGKGHLITLNFSRGNKGNPTRPGETDVFLLDVETGQVTRRIRLADVIPGQDGMGDSESGSGRRGKRSMCRFITFKGKRLYVVDLGLNLVYIVNLEKNTVHTFGGSGKDRGVFNDPAGIVVDDKGYMIIADSRNHRMQVFGKSRQYKGLVFVDRPLRRPSGIFLDSESGPEPALFVLNLWENTMAKYAIR